MADFAKVTALAHAGYCDRKDYPPYAVTPWNDRIQWMTYLARINAELDAIPEPESVEAPEKPTTEKRTVWADRKKPTDRPAG